jgi:hypothetical protein
MLAFAIHFLINNSAENVPYTVFSVGDIMVNKGDPVSSFIELSGRI